MAFLKGLLNSRGTDGEWACDVGGGTHVGLVRVGNEDCFVSIRQPWREAVLAGVADGMGGHEYGEVASYLVIRYLISFWNELDSQGFANRQDAIDYITRALNHANNHIFHVNKVLRIRWAMGTTATIGVFWQHKLILAQVGDSRCYRLRNGVLKLLTADQNWQAEMIDHGILSPAEAEAHPLANMLTNCVGAVRNLHIEFGVSQVQAEDRYLFCTDGISTLVSEGELQRTIGKATEPRACSRELIELALDYGGTDNCTAVCLFA